jgi:DNA-binding FadR family transcriptional regulator
MATRLTPARSLQEELALRLRRDIQDNVLAPGDRLATEQAMMAAYGVSRTVIREAVAALRAEGLVETRQGLGAFVTSDPRQRPFRINSRRINSLADVIKIMELRCALEVESAGQAANNRSQADLDGIRQILKDLDQAVADGGTATEEDFAFHKAIAVASGNEYFSEFLQFLGHFIIPRQSIRAGIADADERLDYLAKVQGEHRLIFEALMAGDETAARDAMRDHLQNSRNRYRRLAEAGYDID